MVLTIWVIVVVLGVAIPLVALIAAPRITFLRVESYRPELRG